MTNTIEKIVENLEKEKNVYCDILELSRKKTEIIRQGKVEELDNIIKAEQSLVMLAGGLRGEREKLSGMIASQMKMDIKELTLSQLMEWVDEPLKGRMKSLQQEFIAVLNEQKQLNDLNQRLIQINLDYIDFTLDLLNGEPQSSELYQQKGKTVPVQRTSLVDRKA